MTTPPIRSPAVSARLTACCPTVVTTRLARLTRPPVVRFRRGVVLLRRAVDPRLLVARLLAERRLVVERLLRAADEVDALFLREVLDFLCGVLDFRRDVADFLRREAAAVRLRLDDRRAPDLLRAVAIAISPVAEGCAAG